jgi:pimeloyl-ACP methyl ester carboxylesterase
VTTTARLRHNRITLTLHTCRAGTGRPLLLLHGLGERAPRAVPDWASTWAGPVTALDFTGHGDSDLPTGGGYTCEVLIGDVDAALAHLGPATLVGRGLGAYVALLAAGGRPALVRGAVLCDGPGLAGGGTGPTSAAVVVPPATGHRPDGWALVELATDVRPPDYATSFARLATQFSGLAQPLAVCATWRPPWLEAVADEPGVLDTTIDDALLRFAAVE